MSDLLVVGGGLILAVAGIIGLISGRRLVRTGQRVTGTVVALQRETDGDGPTYRPVLSFRTLDGRDMRVPSKTSGRPRTGQQVRVLYNPRKPTTVVIDTWAGRGGLLVAIVTGVGVCLLAYGVFTLAGR